MLKKFIAKQFAPYAVHIIPSNLFEAEQIIYAWTLNEATQWAACSLRSDYVSIYRRACKLQAGAFMSMRTPTQEVTQ